MHHCHDGAGTVAEGVRHVAEGEDDPQHDGYRGKEHGDQGRTGDFSAHHWADVAILQGLDAAELSAKLLLDLGLDLRGYFFESCLQAIALIADRRDGCVAQPARHEHIAYLARLHLGILAQDEFPIDAAREIDAQAEGGAHSNQGIHHQQHANGQQNRR